MKVKAIIDCVGLGYELKKDEIAELKDEVGQKLVHFGYVEVLEPQTNGGSGITLLTVDDLPQKSGWYELPNGEKVQGREKAEEALEELNKEKSEE
jgi:hypothetical protein